MVWNIDTGPGRHGVKKVLIVEDELLARVGLRQLVSWEELELELLEDAKDGQEAIDSICTNNPDIILLDLNISRINGLQILDYIRTHGLECKVIVVSCNEEFDMVKEAMKAGAYDYLRKLNLSAEELIETLKKCLASISGETDEQDQHHLGRSEIYSGIRQELTYEDLISRNSFEKNVKICSVLCVIQQEQSSQGKAYKITNYIRKELESTGIDYILVHKGNQQGCFLFFARNRDQDYENLKNAMEEVFNGRCYFGIYENDMTGSAEISNGISMAEQVIYNSFYDEDQRICRITRKPDYSLQSPKDVHDLLKLLGTEVSDFHTEKTVQILEKICDVIKREPYVHINVLRRVFLDVMGIFSMTAQSLSGSIEEIFIDNDNCHYQKVMMIVSLEEMKNWITRFAVAFFRHFLVHYKCSQSEILKQALGYIEAHMYEHIQLIEVAKSIGVSNTYLSTLFKREIGQSFVDYINHKKVDKGKELLQQGKLVYEVSDLLGFENSTYFSKVFKKYQGISPDLVRRDKSSLSETTASES